MSELRSKLLTTMVAGSFFKLPADVVRALDPQMQITIDTPDYVFVTVSDEARRYLIAAFAEIPGPGAPGTWGQHGVAVTQAAQRAVAMMLADARLNREMDKLVLETELLQLQRMGATTPEASEPDPKPWGPSPVKVIAVEDSTTMGPENHCTCAHVTLEYLHNDRGLSTSWRERFEYDPARGNAWADLETEARWAGLLAAMDMVTSDVSRYFEGAGTRIMARDQPFLLTVRDPTYDGGPLQFEHAPLENPRC